MAGPCINWEIQTRLFRICIAFVQWTFGRFIIVPIFLITVYFSANQLNSKIKYEFRFFFLFSFSGRNVCTWLMTDTGGGGERGICTLVHCKVHTVLCTLQYNVYYSTLFTVYSVYCTVHRGGERGIWLKFSSKREFLINQEQELHCLVQNCTSLHLTVVQYVVHCSAL